jgi:hypothetical protein
MDNGDQAFYILVKRDPIAFEFGLDFSRIHRDLCSRNFEKISFKDEAIKTCSFPDGRALLSRGHGARSSPR